MDVEQNAQYHQRLFEKREGENEHIFQLTVSTISKYKSISNYLNIKQIAGGL